MYGRSQSQRYTSSWVGWSVQADGKCVKPGYDGAVRHAHFYQRFSELNISHDELIAPLSSTVLLAASAGSSCLQVLRLGRISQPWKVVTRLCFNDTVYALNARDGIAYVALSRTIAQVPSTRCSLQRGTSQCLLLHILSLD